MRKRRGGEKDFTRAVLDAARLRGWLAAHFHDSRREVSPGLLVGDADAAGFPDIVLVRGARLLFAELKSDKGELRPEQKRWLGALSQVTRPPEVHLWRESDWNELQRVLGRRAA